MTILKPCPFCGNADHKKFTTGGQVTCSVCYAEGPYDYDWLDGKDVKLWNTRVQKKRVMDILVEVNNRVIMAKLLEEEPNRTAVISLLNEAMAELKGGGE